MRYQVDVDSAVWKIIDGEAVVVHADSSEYFGLNASGTALWQILAARKPSAEELAEHLAEQFDRAPVTATKEVTEFIDKALTAGLISKTTGESGGTESTPESDITTPIHSGPYEPPELVKFGDLATLVLSGE